RGGDLRLRLILDEAQAQDVPLARREAAKRTCDSRSVNGTIKARIGRADRVDEGASTAVVDAIGRRYIQRRAVMCRGCFEAHHNVLDLELKVLGELLDARRPA